MCVRITSPNTLTRAVFVTTNTLLACACSTPQSSFGSPKPTIPSNGTPLILQPMFGLKPHVKVSVAALGAGRHGADFHVVELGDGLPRVSRDILPCDTRDCPFDM